MGTASFPEVSFAQWRLLVEKDLAGKPFDKTLVHEALTGVSIAPLYTEAQAVDPAARLARHEPFRICMRHGAGATSSDLVADVAGGADALWIPMEIASRDELARDELAEKTILLEATEVPAAEAAAGIAEHLPRASRLVVCVDPLAWRSRGQAPFATLGQDLAALARLALGMRERGRRAPTALVSTEPYHDAGADAVDEIAFALSTGAAYLEPLLDAGLSPDEASAAIALRITVGRDTFVELCKLRALRVCFAKLLAASGASGQAPALVHAVCSAQTLTVRDPWVNMLRVTTQVFSAVMGGADLVTPNAFDEAFGAVSRSGGGSRATPGSSFVRRALSER